MQPVHKFSKIFLSAALMLIAGAVHAEAAAAQPKTNMLEVMLMIIAIVLAFVIWGMSRVLLALGKEIVRETKENGSKFLSVILLLGFSLLSVVANAQDAAASAEPVKSSFNYGGLSSTEFWMLASVIMLEMIAIIFMAFSIKSLYRTLRPLPEVAAKETRWKAVWQRFDKKFLTKAVPVEKEADVLLDHDYDGIRELDNSLPPWWKYGFYFTIVFGFIYLLNFHVFGTGKNPAQEYQAEMKTAEEQIAYYNEKNKDKIDENNIPMADAAGIAEGKQLFSQTCFPCHGKSAEGGIGPNLTDEYWLHGGSLNDIYHTIKTGYPDKGMQAWQTQFTPKQISELASFIKSIKGSNPAKAKAPQGDLFTEKGSDSTTVKKDSAVVAKTP